MPRLTRLAGPALLVLAAFLSLLAALALGGAAAPLPLADPGAVVRFGLPIATLLVDLGAALTIGTLALTSFALTPDRPEWGRALDLASGAAAFWTIASCATGFFTFLSVANVRVTLDDTFGQSLAFFLTGTDLGLAWLVSTLIAAAVTVLCFAVRNVTLVLLVTLLAGGALVPIAQQGHAAGASSHVQAVTALAVHILAAAVWLGGLLAVVLLRPALERGRVGVVLSRYSTLALVCFTAVAVSGVVSAQIRIGSWSELGSPYGLLVVVKSVALLLLGLFGIVHRRVLIARVQNRLEAQRAPFWWFVAAELAVLGVASGVAAALGRTETPVAQSVLSDTAALTPAEVLTTAKLPPEFTPVRWLSTASVDLPWLLLSAFLVSVYVVGIVRLRRRGEAWPTRRVVSWVLGVLVLAWATSGAPDVYERYLMSTHLLVLALVLFVVPLLLVPAAPWTLALLAVGKRTDGSRGAREWALLVVQSRFAALLSHPVAGAALVALSVWAWTSTPLQRWAVESYAGHTVLVLESVLVGWLFVASLVGRDPVPLRAGTGVRFGLLGLVAAVTAIVATVLATSSALRLAAWYGALGRTWGPPPLVDQRIGGVVLGVVGLVMCAALAVGVLRQGGTSGLGEGRGVLREGRGVLREGRGVRR